MTDPTGTRYTPRVSAEYARTLRRWHDRAYEATWSRAPASAGRRSRPAT